MDKTLKADFKSKDFTMDFTLEAFVDRQIRSLTGENAELFEKVEQSRDNIEISVYDISTNKKIATCHAILSQVVADDDVDLEGDVFDSKITAGIYFAALRLAHQRSKENIYDKPSVSVLVIDNIEVSSKYRKKQVAMKIIDYLSNATSPDFICALVPPIYYEKIGRRKPVKANTATIFVKEFLKSLHLHDYGELFVMGEDSTINRMPIMAEDNINRTLYEKARNPKGHK